MLDFFIVECRSHLTCSVDLINLMRMVDPTAYFFICLPDQFGSHKVSVTSLALFALSTILDLNSLAVLGERPCSGKAAFHW